MSFQAPPPFLPGLPDPAGVISWIHIGDLHMRAAGQQNHRDLANIVAEINSAFAASIAFAFLPGDVADDGSAAEYEIVREALDQLAAPWCAIVGDHDVHEKSFSNFLAYMAHSNHFSFQVGNVRFVALNAFDVPDPGSFCLLPNQLDWLEQQLRETCENSGSAVLFLHCYPSELKQGGDRLRAMTKNPEVRLIDMGHTHYNEVANDGGTLYTATRSTGQVEEGPVGFSVINIDGDVMSWKFLPLGELPAVMITSPADERFITDPALDGSVVGDRIRVRSKAWGKAAIQSATATVGNRRHPLSQVPASNVWQCEFERGDLTDGVWPLRVTVEDSDGKTAKDSIRIVLGASAYHPPQRAQRDLDNSIGPWPERGLLGTQLGPNKNGRKW